MKASQFPTYSIKGKQVEYKTVSFLVKSVDQDQGIVTGIASKFSNVDYGKDMVEPGAYKKTLADGASRMQSGRRFMYPTLWMHTPEQPTGGVIAGTEQADGLEVTMKYDISTNGAGIPNNPIATMVFSGFKEGYIDELSIGYIPIKYDYDKAGVRHLREIQLIEISAVTMNFAMNPEALVPASGVKSMFQHKGASGKTTWPLGERDAAWDNGAAHNRIVDHFTDSDGNLDTAGMKSVHFWFDDSAPENVTSYKLLFCDLVDGAIKAMPRAIFACAGSHGVDAADIPDDDKTSVKSKIETYYTRMAKEFDDDSIVVPWSDKAKRGRFRMDKKDFNDHYREEVIEDWLWSDWLNLTKALQSAILDMFLIGDSPQDDVETTVLNDGIGGPGFITALKNYVQKGIDLDVSNYLNELMQSTGCTDPDNLMWYMSRARHHATKAGRTISAATQSSIEQHQAEMKAMLDEHQKAVADSCAAMRQKVSDLTQLWSEEGQGPAYGNDDDSDSGKSRFAGLTRREPPAKALPRSNGKANSSAQPPRTKRSTETLTLADLESLLV
jgi:HK97 family phage prohead protease